MPSPLWPCRINSRLPFHHVQSRCAPHLFGRAPRVGRVACYKERSRTRCALSIRRLSWLCFCRLDNFQCVTWVEGVGYRSHFSSVGIIYALFFCVGHFTVVFFSSGGLQGLLHAPFRRSGLIVRFYHFLGRHLMMTSTFPAESSHLPRFPIRTTVFLCPISAIFRYHTMLCLPSLAFNACVLSYHGQHI